MVVPEAFELNLISTISWLTTMMNGKCRKTVNIDKLISGSTKKKNNFYFY